MTIFKIFPGRFPDSEDSEHIIIGDKESYEVKDLYINLESIETFSPIDKNIVWVCTKSGTNLMLDMGIDDFLAAWQGALSFERVDITKNNKDLGEDILGDIDFSNFEDD
jgi:hypothetical protein